MYFLKQNAPNKANTDYQDDVEKWQLFLRGLHYDITADGDFGKLTEAATEDFQQEHGLAVDGKVGQRTLAKAIDLGFDVDDDDDNTAKTFPPPPSGLSSPTDAAREKFFDKFTFVADPKPSNPEHIIITTPKWVDNHIEPVATPQLVGVTGAPHDGKVHFHKKKVSKAAQDLFEDWEKAGLIHLVLTWDGSFVPRFIRGSKTTLSNHAYGSAFDINYQWNKRGTTPALAGHRGSVRELVKIANEHGFYWGGHFAKTKDGMHFEYADF